MALKLTILGTTTPYPQPDQPCSGYLVTSPTVKVWLEAGSGTLSVLQRFTELDELDALWFSHMHPDHAGDLPAIAGWLLNRSNQHRPLAVYGPPGWLDRLDAFLPSPPELLRRQITAYELFDGHSVDVGDLKLTSRAVSHTVETFGVRVELGSRTLAYSGDSGPCVELDELAYSADVFLCEAGVSVQSGEKAFAHCTPEDAAQTAKRASVGRLLLTHLDPAAKATTVLARAVAVHQDTALATSGTVYEI